jgi:hypothetical protein
MQELLDAALERAPDRVKAQFSLIVSEEHRVTGDQPSHKAGPLALPLGSMTSSEWTRDDVRLLSQSFDAALERSAIDDIERLAHAWLISEPPQAIELNAGRRVSDALITAVEHRVVQLRRADDFITGSASRDLVRNELEATVRLLSEGALTDEQARRALTAIGELAQLGAWVAADAGLIEEAARFVRGGILSARAAGDAPLAANLISTFSYQVANTGNPNEAIVLSRTAYQGGKRDATPVTGALLLERVAWSAAKAGDLRSCERALGLVEESFSGGARDNDPDWVYWLSPEEIDVMAGRCYTELRKPDRAERLLANAISRYNQSLVRENSLYLSWLAEDYVQLGDIEASSRAGSHRPALSEPCVNLSTHTAPTIQHHRSVRRDCHAETPVREHSRSTFFHALEPCPRFLARVLQALVLPHCPPHDIYVETTESGIQRGLVELPVISGPARDTGVYEGDNLGEGHVTAPVNAPAPDLMTDPGQRLPADRGRETDKEVPSPAFGQPRPERVPQERELLMLERAGAAGVLAVHYPGFHRVQFQPALRHPGSDLVPDELGLGLAAAVHDRVIAVALERDGRVGPGHPRVKRVMHEKISQQR